MATESELLDSVIRECLDPKQIQIKYQQLEAISNILRGKDTLCILPTGFGKSLIYQLLPAVFSKTKSVLCHQQEEATNPVVIVLSPLLSLIKDQVTAANKSGYGLRASSLSTNTFENISSGKFNILFGTPESWLKIKKWREMLSNKFFSTNLVCIVIDEVHKVTWGSSGDADRPFREIFGQISIVRSVCPEKVPVLALSATINCDLTQLVIESCNLSKNLKIISSCVDRENIRLSVVKIKNKNFDAVKWIAEKLLKDQESSPRIIIYCRSVNLVGWLYSKFLKFLQKHLPVEKCKTLIGMFHCMTYDKNKQTVLDSLTSPESYMRLVIATSSLGCGVNAANISFVIHFGPSYDLVDYCQQIGRAGRNSYDQAHAVLYAYTEGNAKVSKNMKSYIKSASTNCLRSTLYSPFNQECIMPLSPAHNCCSFCSIGCDCQMESCTKSFFYETDTKQVSCSLPVYREVSEEMQLLVKEILIQFRQSSLQSTVFMPLEIVSGLPDVVIDEILCHLPFINSIEYLEEHISIIDDRVLREVILIIKEVFDDFEFVNNFSSLELNDDKDKEPEKLVFTSEFEVASSCDSEFSDI